MIDLVVEEAETRMEKRIEAFRRELTTLRAGRATPALVERIKVDYYGTPTPLNQLANISAPEPRLLVISPWDRAALDSIEKAIMKSDLGITPNSDGKIIRLAVPQLTAQRRGELAKTVKKMAEEARVHIRNYRREANDQLKALEKEGEISEDDCRRAQSRVQEVTDGRIKEIDVALAAKEKEIMEV